MQYATNYGGPLRKADQINKGTSYQLYATVLVDVCYRIYGRVVETALSPQGNNHLHAGKDAFMRRLKQGSLRNTPCLGWSEFTTSYFGPFRDETRIQDDINLVIPSMLQRVFEHDTFAAAIKPQFVQDVKIEKGVLHFAE